MVKSRFQQVYPAKGRITLDGGLNNKFSRSEIGDSESPDCLNVIYDEGAVMTRGGTSLLNTASVGSYACDGLFTRHSNAGAESMVAWFNGSLYQLSGTTFNAVASGTSVYTAGQRVGAAEYENYLFMGNGGSIPYKYKDGELTRHGVYPPTETMTVSNASTGSVLNGVYSYKATYVNSNLVESDLGPATTYTFASQNGYLTSIPIAPQSFGVNSRRIYRTDAGGEIYYRVDTIDDNETTTYEDGIASSAVGSEAPSDQGVPPNYKSVITHQSRLFVIDPSENTVKYSEIANPYVFKALSFRYMGDKTFDIPLTLGVFDNAVVVGCRQSHWLIYMPDADDTNWVDVKIITPYGSKSPFCNFKYNNKLMFAATEDIGANFVGFAAITGNAVEPDVTLLSRATLGSDLKSNKIESETTDYKDSLAEGFAAIVYKNRAYIAAAKTVSATYNNRMLYFDFSIENLNRKNKFAWSPWDGINANDFTIYDDKLYYSCSNDCGHVFQMNTSSYNDNGTAINSYVWTKELAGAPVHEAWSKDFRWLNMFYELSGDWFMGVTVRIDSDKGGGSTTQIPLDPGGSVYGTMIWGQDPYDAGRQEFENKFSIGSYRGKRIQIKFDNQNTVGQSFKVIGLALTYNIRGLR